jgi:hypothetical protein
MKALLRAVGRLAARIRKPGADYPHFHFGSLMDDRGGCDRCPIWSGRCWWHADGRRCVRLEWHWFTLHNRSLGAGVQVGGGESDGDVQLSLSVPWLCNLYLTTEGYLSPRPQREWELRYLLPGEFGEGGTLAFNFAHCRDFYGAKIGGVEKWIDIADLVMGRDRYEAVQEARYELEVNLIGEPTYQVDAVVERATWTRTRPGWRWRRKTRLSVDLSFSPGIPVPGKGENSWDCGDDAVYSIHRPVDDASEEAVVRACDKAVAGIRKTRRQRGGEDWKPAPEAEATTA